MMPKQKRHVMNSALHIPLTLSCVLDTFLEKTSCLFLSHFSNLAVENEFAELLLAHAQDIVGIIANLFFLVHVFDRK